jgi:hypothetical protein
MVTLGLWDIAAGILIAFMVAGGVIYGLRNNDKGVAAIAAVFMAAIVIWRAGCWYSGGCPAPDHVSVPVAILEHQ